MCAAQSNCHIMVLGAPDPSAAPKTPHKPRPPPRYVPYPAEPAHLLLPTYCPLDYLANTAQSSLSQASAPPVQPQHPLRNLPYAAPLSRTHHTVSLRMYTAKKSVGNR